MQMFDYTLYPDNNNDVFEAACKKIQEHFPAAEKKKLLVDVDGSLIQTFVADGKEINVYDDYDVGAVYIE